MRMKKKILCALALVMAVVTLTSVANAAFSSNVLDNPNYTYGNNGISYVEKTVSEGGTQKLFYGEYNSTANGAKYEWVVHSVRQGTKTTLKTVMDIAKDYEKQTGKKVMLAANGDYFDFGSGANMESYVVDGIVISKGSFATKHCIGFDNKGKVVIGRMTEVEKRLMVVIDGKRTFFNIDQINKEPGNDQIAIYTTPGTYTIQGAGKYVCGSTSTNLNQFPVFGSSRRLTTGTVTNNDSFTLKSGQFAVVVKGKDAQYFYDNIKYGVEVDLVEIPAGRFAGCTWVLGGYDMLVDNGTVNTNPHTDNSGNANAPRTFIGFKADGTAFICVADGRGSGGATGITVKKEAELAKALGAKYALELDGGGSSTMIVRINDVLTLRNKPSDGSMRQVSNAILLVEKTEKSEDPKPTTPTTTTPTTKPATVPTTTQPTTVPGTTQPNTQPTTQPTTVPTTVPVTEPTTEPATDPTQPTTVISGDDTPSGNGLNPFVLGAAIGGAVVVVAAIVIICVVAKRKRKQ